MLSDALEPDVPVEAGAKIIWTRYIGEDYRETEGAPISWMMHVQLAQALAELGWAKPSLVDIRDAKDEDFKLPEEIEAEAPIREGAKKTIVVNAYERSLEARAKCIQHYGYRCSACGLMLAEKYGEAAAERLIHVHHLCPQAERNGEYQIDPIQDLRPVCPNCHAVIHNHSPIFTVEEVRSMIEQQAKLVTTPPKTA
jgi:predicted HNH restriction endonuclease